MTRFENMTGNMKNLYISMWGNNDFIKQAEIDNSVTEKGDIIKKSVNSFSFVDKNHEDKEKILANIFDITDKELFAEKLCMACSGSGQELRRITTLHSSSLCALLFFYNVTEANPLTIDEVGTFTDSVFEFQSPVINNQSNMDVVLIGKDNVGKDILLFLESKFSEYINDTTTALKISEAYKGNEYSENIYVEDCLKDLDIGITKSENGYFTITSTDKCYLGGIKQMISHYIGIRNLLDCKKTVQKCEYQNRVHEKIDSGAKIYLGEILFDHVIGDFEIGKGNKCFADYSKKYNKLAGKLNRAIGQENKSNRFVVLEDDLKYSMFRNDGYKHEVEDKILQFYNLND